MLRYFTVEYDGYTYKREEQKEEEKVPGINYLVSTLQLEGKERRELEKIIGRMNTKSKWKDMSDKQERIYSKMEKILSKLKAYTPFSVPFLSKVSKREAPEYYNLIKTPIDLGKIGKKLLMQEYSDVNDFSKDLDLIWENCFKFNNTHGNVYAMYAQKMKEKSLVLLQDLFSEREIKIEGDKEEVDHFLRTEKYRKEMVATRAAILQNPAEFTTRRTSEAMGEYWKEEIKISEEIENSTYGVEKEKIHLPEYRYFYNSFPVQKYTEIHPFSTYSIGDLEIENPVCPRNSRAAVKEPQKEKRKIFYDRGKYRKEDGDAVENVQIGKKEVTDLFRRLIVGELVSVGFTNTETSALNILVSYIMHRVEATMKQIAEFGRKSSFDKSTEETVRQIVHRFQLKSLEVEKAQFISEDEEETDDESIINMIYSNAEDQEIEIEDELM